jgi:hypothetical protein
MCKHPSLHTHMHPYRIGRGSDTRGVRSSRGGRAARGAISGRTRGRGARQLSSRVLESLAILVPKRQAPEHLLFVVCKYLTCVLFMFVALCYRSCLKPLIHIYYSIFLDYLDISRYPIKSSIGIYA